MFEALLASVLNKVLGDYVTNLETKQLSVGIWNGAVVLHNLRLKREALDKFNLPIDVQEGFLGDLTLNIPWNDLKNKPVQVFINNMYLLAGPKAETDYDPDIEEEKAHKVKMEKVEAAELLDSSKNKLAGGVEDKQNASFVTQLVTKIVDNLQISIQNIHIRYEDRTGRTEPFSFGITLSELSAVSTDENWNETFLHEEIGVIHKLVKLGSLAVYWNTDNVSLGGKPVEESIKVFTGLIASGSFVPAEHQYILKPVSGVGRLRMNKLMKDGQPKTSCALAFDELGFVLDDMQYLSFLGLIGTFSALVRSQKYRKYRPPLSITPSIDPLAWFKYAGTCVLSEIHERNYRWSWPYMEERRNDRKLYVSLYKKSKSGAAVTPEDAEIIKQLERKLSYKDIRFYRSIAGTELRREKAAVSAAAPSAAAPKTTYQWLGEWWSGSTPAPNDQGPKPNDTVLNEENMKKFLDTIDYDPNETELEGDLPRDAIVLSLEWVLQRGSFAIKKHAVRNEDFLAVVFENLLANFTQRPTSFEAGFSVIGMTVTDGTTPGTLYPTIIQATKDIDDAEYFQDEAVPFFSMHFEHSPLDDRADDALNLQILPLQVIVNPAAINGVIEFFTPPPAEADTITAIQTVAQDTFQELSAQTRASLEYAIDLHRTLDIKVDIAAPIFIIPESVKAPDSTVVIVDAGHLLVESDLVNQETKKELEKKQGTELSASDYIKLQSLLYDRFTCTLTSAQILVSNSVEKALHEIHAQRSSQYHFLDKVDLSFSIEVCILPKLTKYPRLVVAGKLPRLHINLSDKKYKAVMKTLDLLTKGSGNKTPPPLIATPSRIDWSNSNFDELVLPSDPDADSFYDASENLEPNARKQAEDSPERVFLKFVFEVGMFSASLKKSYRDIMQPEKPLAILNISGFELQVRARPRDMNVRLQIKNVNIEDLVSPAQQESPKYLLKSRTSIDGGESEDFILIEYVSLKPNAPDYVGFDQSVNISFASVDVVLLKESVLVLYDFLLATFTSGGQKPSPVAGSPSNPSAPQAPTSSTMIIRLSMKSVNFMINQNLVQIATASFGAAQLSIKLLNTRMEIAGRLGNLTVTDDVQRCSDRKFKQLLRIEGSEVADFTLDTYNRNDKNYPGYDTSLKLRTASLRMTFIEPLLTELSTFFSEFQRMHILLDSARKAAMETQETAGKFHYDIQLGSPIIEFPELSLTSDDMLIMYLGQIVARNSFIKDTVSNLVVDVQSLKLLSVMQNGSEAGSPLKMIEDVNITIKISNLLPDVIMDRPNMLLNATVSDIRMKLSRKQYLFFMQIFSAVTSFFAPPQKPNTAMTQSDSAESIEWTDDSVVSSPQLSEKILSDMSVAVDSISLEIFSDLKAEDDNDCSVARFSLKSTTYNSVSYGDMQEMEIHSRCLNIVDTRKSTENIFREIMPLESSNNDQISIRVCRKQLESNYHVTLDKIRFILVLDHLFEVRNFFSSNGSSQQQTAADDSTMTGNMDENAPTMTYRVSMVDFEVILLQNPKQLSSEAIIMMAKEFVVGYDQVTTVSLLDMGMFFCVMDNRAETTLRFIQNFDMTLVMDNRLTAPGHILNSINIDISPLLMRISYHDILLISEIMNQFSTLSQKGDQPTDTPVTKPEAPQILMSRERVQATTQGIRLILIDDLNDLQLPMFDFVIDKLVLEVADWSSEMRIDTGLKVHVNNFNTRNSHWEPLIETFEFYLNISRQGESTSVDVYARKKLELNLSHVFVETMLNTLSLWSARTDKKTISRTSAGDPYILRNKTGYKMHVWIESAGDGLDTELFELAPDTEIPWRFDDWRVLRESVTPTPNKISLQIHGPSWETLKGISVDKEGTKTYLLRPSINRVPHRLVCDVKMKGNMKVVTFQSAMVVQNLTNIPVEVITVNPKGSTNCGVYNLAPGDERPIPIEAAYYDRVLVRPHSSFDYVWCDQPLNWRDMQKKENVKLASIISCKSSDSSTSPFLFQVNAVCPEDKESLLALYPCVSLKLLPPFQLENLLPYDIKYQIFDKTAQQNHAGSLAKGSIEFIHTVDPTHALLLNIDVVGTDLRHTEMAILHNPDLDYRDDQITLKDASNNELHLRIKYSDKVELGGRKVCIYSPYVLLNRTGLDLRYKSRSLIGAPKLAAGQGDRKDPTLPFMFSYTNFEPLRNRAVIQIGDSDMSKPVSFEAVGSSFDIIVPSSSTSQEIHIGATVREGDGKFYLTKVVTFTPRYVVKNNFGADLYCRQQATSPALLVNAGQSIPLHHFYEGYPEQLYLRMTGLVDAWSSPFSITQIGRIYVKLGRMGSAEEILVRTEVILEDATIFIILAQEEGRWPFRLENKTDVDVHFWQTESKNRYLVKAGDSIPYSWDAPTNTKKSLILNVNGKEREIDVREIGQLIPFKYPVPGSPSRTGIIAIHIFAEGPTLIIQLGPYLESTSIYRQGTVRKDNPTDVEGFQMKAKEEREVYSLQVRLEGIGVSVIDKSVKELLYASAKNVAFSYVNSTSTEALAFSINWLQIDNQLYGSPDPIFLYPTVLPKEGEEDVHPVLMASLSKSKDSTYGVDFFNWFTILLQELSIDMDEEFLFALINFAKFEVAGWEKKEEVMFSNTSSIPEPRIVDGDTRMYFEKFLLQPVQFNISFQRTQSVNIDEARASSRNILVFLFDVFTMTVGNIHDAPIRLNALEIYHPIVTFSQLVDLMLKFYSQEVVGQLHKVIGSADFLGNPVGLFNNVGSGVRDFFYEPIQGFEITRPQDFGIGLAKGTTSLFKKTIYGVTDTFSKITGSVSKGLAVITLDEEFQEQRRLTRARNKPKHAVYGVTAGATSLVTSVASGVTGVLSKPVEGFEKDGVGGFFKGLGKGLVGVVSKPLIGVFDFATNVTEGIRNTTTVFDKELEKVRLPRFVSKDGILTPFDAREALGLKWLKGLENGKYFRDDYFAHLELRIEDLVVIVTHSRVLMAKMKSYRVDWEISYDELQLVRIDNGGITLVKKGRQQARARIIPCPDQASAQWLLNRIEKMFSEANSLQI